MIESLEPAGVGALMALLEERKKKLAAEGLFDEARKQLLPFLPGVIGVVTSPTGAVIRDILHRLADRFPRHVIVWPVRVQGDGSAEEVAAAIRGFNALPAGGRIPRPDVLIVARGGGSLEDLWSFNEEIVVRAAAESMIPLISAVGHETDVTLIDFAADKRAPTPTAAAEMAVPVRAELLAQIDSPRAARGRPAGRAAWMRAAPNCAPPRARCRARTNCWRAAPAARLLVRAAAARAARQCADPSQAISALRRAAFPAAVARARASAGASGSTIAGARLAAAICAQPRERIASASCATASASRALFERGARRECADRAALRARCDRADQLLAALLLSGRAGARLCAGARSVRPSDPQRGRDQPRPGARHRVQRWARRPRSRPPRMASGQAAPADPSAPKPWYRRRAGELVLMAAHIDVTHVGSLPRGDELTALLLAKDHGKPYDAAEFDRVVQTRGRRCA